MEIRSGLSKLSVISQVSAVEGCPLSGVPLYSTHLQREETQLEFKVYLSTGHRYLEALWYFTDSSGKTGPA